MHSLNFLHLSSLMCCIYAACNVLIVFAPAWVIKALYVDFWVETLFKQTKNYYRMSSNSLVCSALSLLIRNYLIKLGMGIST